jgi:hypothetical protein
MAKTAGQAAWYERHAGPDPVSGSGPNRFVTAEVTRPTHGAISLRTGKHATRSGSQNEAGESRPRTSPRQAGLDPADGKLPRLR